MLQFSNAIRSLLSRAAVLFHRDDAEALPVDMPLVLHCNRLLRCCCIMVAGFPGVVLFRGIAKRIVAMRGSRHATAWSSACAKLVGGEVLDDAVLVCGTTAVQQIGAVISEQDVNSFVLMLWVMVGFALIINLPSVAATSHRVD